MAKFDPIRGAEAMRRRLLGKKVVSAQERRKAEKKAPKKSTGSGYRGRSHTTTGAEGQMRFSPGARLDASQVEDRRGTEMLPHHIGRSPSPVGPVSKRALARRMVRGGRR